MGSAPSSMRWALSGESTANTGLPWASASLHSFAKEGEEQQAAFGLAALFGVGDKKAGGEGGDMGVTLSGDVCRGAADAVAKEGEEQQAAFD